MPRGGLVLVVVVSAGCALDVDVDTNVDEQPATCASEGPDVYSPYALPAHYPTGPAAWRGERFDEYTGAPPTIVECASDKHRRAYLDVTAGCLSAVAVGAYTRGRIQPTADGYFRAIALGFDSADPVHPEKWTDQTIRYGFYYSVQTGDAGNPGFKAFARYRTEDDLYVASWRSDGVVQIQKKQCGIYTPLAIVRDLPGPSPNAWHTLQFSAIGEQLSLSLDGHVALSAIDHTFSWGTAGIRIDAMAGAYLDDWTVN
jgi:hypothetical protein